MIYRCECSGNNRKILGLNFSWAECKNCDGVIFTNLPKDENKTDEFKSIKENLEGIRGILLMDIMLLAKLEMLFKVYPRIEKKHIVKIFLNLFKKLIGRYENIKKSEGEKVFVNVLNAILFYVETMDYSLKGLSRLLKHHLEILEKAVSYNTAHSFGSPLVAIEAGILGLGYYVLYDKSSPIKEHKEKKDFLYLDRLLFNFCSAITEKDEGYFMSEIYFEFLGFAHSEEDKTEEKENEHA